MTTASSQTFDSQKSGLRNRWRELLENPGVPELFLVIVTFIVYARSLGFDFVYDDHGMVTNPFQLTLQNVLGAFTNDYSLDHASNFYRPFTVIWQGMVASLAGTSAVVWHLSGILLHLACVVLVFRLAYQLLKNKELAVFAAAVFALHPTHVEAVTWISDAADSLMTIFLLLASLALLRWVESEKPGWCVLAWFFAGCCCFVKETGVIVPVLLAVLLFGVETRIQRPTLTLVGGAFFATAFGFLVLRNQMLHGFAHPLSKAGNDGMLLTEPAAIWFYLSHLLFPVKLGPFYPLAFISNWHSSAFLVPLMLVLAIFTLAAWIYARMTDRRRFWFCVVWGLAPLAAPLYLKLFPPFELVHDRYLYIPSIALGIAIATLSAHFKSGGFKRWVQIVAVTVVVGAAAQTLAYQGVWKNDKTLFERAVEITPDNDRAIVNLGVNELMAGNVQAGSALMKRALELQPNNTLALVDLGKVAWNNNDPASAEGYIERAVDLEARPDWLVLLASIELKLGKPADAELAARQALQQNPTQPDAHLMLGEARRQQSDLASAIQEFRAELAYYPGNASAQRALQAVQNQVR